MTGNGQSKKQRKRTVQTWFGCTSEQCTGLAACGLLGGSTCIGRMGAKGAYTGRGGEFNSFLKQLGIIAEKPLFCSISH